MGLRGESGEPARGGACPPRESELDKGEEGTAPFPSPSPSLFPIRKKGKGGPTRTRSPSRFPPHSAPPCGRPPPSPPLYTGAGGHPKAHQLFLSRVRCPLQDRKSVV